VAFLHWGVYNGNWTPVLPDDFESEHSGGVADLVVAAYLPFGGTPAALSLYYRGGLFGGDGAAPPPEEGTYQPFLVRVPFRRFGRNVYLQNTAQDFDAPPPAEESTYPAPPRLRRFVGLGRNPYLQHQAWDTTVEPFDLPSVVRAKPYRGIRGRNPYLWHQDWDSIPAAPEVETAAPWLVRRPLVGLGRNPYLQNAAQDFSVPAEVDTYAPFLVRRDLGVRLAARAAYRLLATSTQDEDAPSVGPASDYTVPHHHYWHSRR
jgi:hypothetical protein